MSKARAPKTKPQGGPDSFTLANIVTLARHSEAHFAELMRLAKKVKPLSLGLRLVEELERFKTVSDGRLLALLTQEANKH